MSGERPPALFRCSTITDTNLVGESESESVIAKIHGVAIVRKTTTLDRKAVKGLDGLLYIELYSSRLEFRCVEVDMGSYRGLFSGCLLSKKTKVLRSLGCWKGEGKES
jgi:hypothetical protein